MEADESLICTYLKLYQGQFVSAAEICRRAGTRKQYQRDRHWALPILKRLVEKGILQSDSTGHYRFVPPREKDQKKKWISPEIRKILQQSGKTFEVVDPEQDTGSLDEHYRG